MERQLGAASQQFDSTLTDLAYQSAQSDLTTEQRVESLQTTAANRLGEIGLRALNSQLAIDQRSRQSGLTRDQRVGSLQVGQINDLAQINLDNIAKQVSIDNRSAQSTLASMDAVASYVNAIRSQGIAANQLLSQTQDEGKSIQEQIVISEQLDTIQRDAQQITALLEGADKRASSVARGGGSNSARRVAMDSMKAFGRSYNQMKVEQQNRRRQLTNYNSKLTGETAAEFAQAANSIANQRDRIQSTQASSALNQAGFLAEATTADLQRQMSSNATMLSTALGINQANQTYDLEQAGLLNESNIVERQRQQDTNALMLSTALGINQANQTNTFTQGRLAGLGQEAQRSYDFTTNNLLTEYNQLTLPSFDLAARQGEREYQALLQNTMNTIQGASTPYQDAILIDPLEPIAGLEPQKGMMTPVAKPSWGSILAGSFLQGAQGALGMSYTNASGNLAFR